MMSRQRAKIQFLIGCIVLLFGFGFVSSTIRAQVPSLNLKKDLPKYTEVIVPLSQMREGGKKVVTPDKKETAANLEAMAAMAKWNAYRLNTPPYNGELDDSPTKDNPSPTEDKPITVLFKDVTKYMLFPNNPEKGFAKREQFEYANEFGKAMEKELKVMLQPAAKPIVRINAARMLALTAQMPVESLADTFLEILKDKNEIDAVKLYACQGLQNLLKHADPIQPERHLIRDPKKQAEIANTLIEMITKPYPTGKDPEGDRVVQFLRRDMVRALSGFRDSVIRDNTQKVLATPGATLIRVAMAESQFQPEISLSEQIEGLVGFCSMKIDKDMDLSAATHAVNMAMLDIIRKQNPSPNHPGREKTIPWKVAAVRLENAMKLWREHADTLPVAMEPKLISEWTKKTSDSVLTKYIENGLSARPDASPLNEWFQQKPLKSKQLLKSDSKTTLEWEKGEKK